MSNSQNTNKSKAITITKITIDTKNKLIKILLRQGFIKIQQSGNTSAIWQVMSPDNIITIKSAWEGNTNEWEINGNNNLVIRQKITNAWEVVGHNTYLYIRKQNKEWHIAGEYGDIFVFNIIENGHITEADVDDLMVNENLVNKIAGIFAVAICIFASHQKRKYTQI